MKTIQIYLPFVLFFLFPVFTFSQVEIFGKISFRNKAVEDVNIYLKDSYDGATSDKNGNYSFVTTEKGKQILVFSHKNYSDVEIPVFIETEKINQNIKLAEKINEIKAVKITAGAIEASDKKRATALLSSVDIYTVAGGDAQISSALTFLPGVQKIGETEGLFIRGGNNSESKIFMDGNLVNHFFSNSVSGIAGRERLDMSLFKGNIFSSGGYSALYGQALSGVLILESVDFPEENSYNFALSPLFVNGGFQQLNSSKKYSFGANFGYFNLGLITKTLPYNTDFIKIPKGFNGNFNFRLKTKNGGFLKYYGSVDNHNMAVKSENLETETAQDKVDLSAVNTFHNFSFKQKLGRYLIHSGLSFSYNISDLDISFLKNEEETALYQTKKTEYHTNFKTIIERKINRISTIKAGFEWNHSREYNIFNHYKFDYKDLIFSGFAETDLAFSNYFSAKLGIRSEHSSFLNKTNIAPRFALAYKLAERWTTSLAYGIFYQNPESKYAQPNLDFQRAEHYIFQIQRAISGRNLRLEIYYKNYENLIKTTENKSRQIAENNNGNGFAKGLELFWRDKKTFKNIDYWLSYSYLDTKRNYLNFPTTISPNFASPHTFSFVAKKFVTHWKTGFNLSYTFAKGRPYYDIFTQNGNSVIRNQGRLKNFNSLNFSINYLPNLGRKNHRSFTVLVFSISNILGNKNEFGYRFSNDGNRKSAILSPTNTATFIGAFFSFGADKTEDAINRHL
ncbi:MAG: carboxypeptidase-like regulatory domain-containing protein [Cruoricaptor ignavus]|nr:carboxypeptidase-like regulatory domain-containing protein [Cruoricaptor ignavus]